MNRRAVNAALVVAALAIYAVLGSYAGRRAINGGLGPDGQAYAAMVTSHDLQGRSVGDRLWPAFPLATAAVYAVTGNIVSSFTVVNVVAVVLLAFAACLIFDAFGAPDAFKASGVLSLAVLGVPTAITAFSPGEPYLLGVALAALAVAAIETSGWFVISLTQVAAALASPVGLMAPLYGLWRSARTSRRSALELLAFAGGILLWLLVQVWARGGPAGLMDLIRFSRVRSDAILWTESTFLFYAVYFLVTSLGGLSILLIAKPGSIRDTLAHGSESFVLLVVPLAFIITAGLDAPAVIAFLIPFWLVAGARRASTPTASPAVAAAVVLVLTIVTQHPWTPLDDTRYFVDWFPYSVYAQRISTVNVSRDALAAIWRTRVLIAAAAVVAAAVWQRRDRS